MGSEDLRDWRISEALDQLEPLFDSDVYTPEEIEKAAKLFGMPAYAMWTAHHLYEVISEYRAG